MAKRRDELEAMARSRQAGARIATLSSIKDLWMRIGGMKEVREPGKNGQVVKCVSTLLCQARVAGMADLIDMVIELDTPENAGVSGEIELTITPACLEFLDAVTKKWLECQEEKQRSEIAVLHPTPANRPPSPHRVENTKKLNASRRLAALRLQKAAEAAAVEIEEEETPESAVTEVTEEATPDPDDDLPPEIRNQLKAVPSVGVSNG